MRPHDRTAFLEVIVGFAELKGRQLSAPAIELYWNAMQGWSIDEFRAAANVLIRTCEFMPTPKDFEELRKAPLPTKGEAWAAVLRHLRGGYRAGGLAPEIDRAVHALGGYRHLAMMPTDQLTWQEKRFAEHYGDAREADAKREPAAIPPALRNLLT